MMFKYINVLPASFYADDLAKSSFPRRIRKRAVAVERFTQYVYQCRSLDSQKYTKIHVLRLLLSTF